MNEYWDAEATPTAEDEELLEEFEALWAEAQEIWVENENDPAFFGYVSADYLAVFEALIRLRGRVLNIVEWGSGLGIVAIMASRMGFDAYGIEAEGPLVEHAERLAEVYGPSARFAHGSFIPDEFVWDPLDSDEISRTVIDVPSGYDHFDMELRDFDLVYAYPWPTEHEMYRNIMRECAADNSLLLTYDIREGINVMRF